MAEPLEYAPAPRSTDKRWLAALSAVLAAISLCLWLWLVLGAIAGRGSMLGLSILIDVAIAFLSLLVALASLVLSKHKKAAVASIVVTVGAALFSLYWIGDDPSPRVTKVRTEAAQYSIYMLKTKLEEFRKDNARLPTTAEGLVALVECPPGLETSWKGPYVGADALNDRWMHPFVYRIPARTPSAGFDLFSAGRDGVPGTSDDITKAVPP